MCLANLSLKKMKKIIITTSWDDGHRLDLKLKNLLLKYNIPATFYVPISNKERDCMNSTQINEIARKFDIIWHVRKDDYISVRRFFFQCFYSVPGDLCFKKENLFFCCYPRMSIFYYSQCLFRFIPFIISQMD